MFMESLWGSDFNIVDTKKKTKEVLNKVKEPKKEKEISTERILKSKKVSTEDKIKVITNNVYKILGKQINNIIVIKTKEELNNYIDFAIKQGVISIDTETNNSLDPITCKLMGLCLYTPNNKQAYIPINHIDYTNGEKLSWQLTENDCKEALQKIVDSKTYIIMHNGKFDYQVIKCTCNIEVKPDWDTLIAAKLINENEQAGLKFQYILHIDSDQEKYSIENLFEKQEYSIFPPEVFALYAATDALMTYRLYKEYQLPIMESKDFSRIYKLFMEVEMPCIEVVANMELTGIALDIEYSKRLSEKYHKKLLEIDSKIENELEKYKNNIKDWRLTPDANFKQKKKTGDGYSKSKSEQLEEPINLGSPSQLAILLYDILKSPVVDEKTPRGTGEECLEKIDLPLCKLLLERRGVVKLIDAFIDVLPKISEMNPDGRIRTHFNQYGAATGRFSSSAPINLQQIPSHEKSIRMMFKASDGYVLIGSDFSAQEPRLLSQLSNDQGMIKAYKEGKDLYATIAMGVYKNSYWDNMEHHEDGTPNPDGKKRRGNCKSLLLGIMYSRGISSIAEQIHGTREEAQNIVDNFFKSFPKVKDIIDESHKMGKDYGYVEDLWGRRRRLPDIQLNKYEIIDHNKSSILLNPFLNCENKTQENDIVVKYYNMLDKVKNKKEKNEIISLAKKHNLEVKDNTSYISQAERQCLNARIQGSAATMTKIAMNKLYRDKELNDLGFKLLIGVHDELIGECPKENSEAVANRLTYIMSHSVEDVVDKVPFKCDADICEHWYYNDYSDIIKKEYEDLKKMNLGEDAKYQLYRNHTEMTHQQLDKIIN